MKHLTTIRKRKSTEEGFSMVTAAGFGLVIMMIGLTIMSRSMKDNTISASQKVNNRSLAAAESGVSMYLSLLNKKGTIALPTMRRDQYDESGTTPTLPAGGRDDWSASTNLTPAEINKTKGWQDIVAGDSTKGQYKLLSYVPDGNGKAVLKVQGRVNQTGFGSAATEDISTGMTTVEAIIGVNEIAAPSSLREVATQITANPAEAAAAARTAAGVAKTASDAAMLNASLANNLTASTANNDANKANIIASGANTVTTPSSLATVAAASATESARYATNSAASAVYDAQVAANETGANSAGSLAASAANTAAVAAAKATAAASAANTAAAAANIAASTGNIGDANIAKGLAEVAAATAADEADKADLAAKSLGTVVNTSGSGSGSLVTTTNPVTDSATATTKAVAAVNAANTAITAGTIANLETASTANAAASNANTTASVANKTTTPSAAATVAASAATQSAIDATSYAASAVASAKAAAGATGANVAGSSAAQTAAVNAAAAVNAVVAAANANTAAAAANTAASTGNTSVAQAEATKAAAAATSAQTAAQMVFGVGATRFPGLWLIDGPNNSGTSLNQTFRAYGLVTNTPATSLWTSPNAPANSNTPHKEPRTEVENSISKTPPPFPMSKCLIANSNPTINPSFLNSVDLATRISSSGGSITFPATTDRAGADGIYRYYASNLNIQGNAKVRFSASAKVIVYLQGDMITKGNVDIIPCADGTCNLNNLVIYGYKAGGQLSISGNTTVGAFVIAPTYSAGINGGGNGEGYKGALWAREWIKDSNSNKFVVNQDGNKDQNLACPYTNPTIQVISQAVVPNS